MTGSHCGHRKSWAGVSHRLSEAAAVDVADRIEVAVDKQNGLTKTAVVRGAARIFGVDGVIQIPSIGWPKASAAKRRDQVVKVGGRPKRRIRRRGWGAMRGAVATTVGRDHGGR